MDDADAGWTDHRRTGGAAGLVGRGRRITWLSLGTCMLQALLGDPRQLRAARGVADVALELGALAPRAWRAAARAPALFARAATAEAPPPDDACRHEDETERARGRRCDRPRTLSPPPPATRRHARRCALRARGLRAISSRRGDHRLPGQTCRPADGLGRCTRAVLGGRRRTRLHSRKACLTSRSSPEW